MGITIRLPILVVAPIIPYIQHDLALSGAEIGILSGIPMVLLAVAALPGSAVIERIGSRRALLLGLAITGLGSTLRGFFPSTWLLFATTALMSFGIAIVQPALPAAVRAWMPKKIGWGTAVYSNGMISGCIIPVSLTLTVVMPMVDNDWRWDLIVWSCPAFLVLLLVARFAPATNDSAATARNAGAGINFLTMLRALDFRLVLKIGLVFGANNCVYFGTNAFLPPYLVQLGRPDLVTQALTAYNILQLLSSVLILVFAKWIEGRSWPFFLSGCCILANLAWLFFGDGSETVLAVTCLGFLSGVTLVIGLMLPPTLSGPGEVARTAAAMFTISYALAMSGLATGGIVWDLGGHPKYAFLMLAVCALPLVLIPPLLRFPQRQ